MATTKKSTTTKTTTAKRAAVKQEEPKIAERNIFEVAAERFPIAETAVDTGAGTVNVKNRISLTDMITLVNYIASMCMDSQTGEVKWEFFEFATRASVVAAYCGVSIPEDIDAAYAAVCGKDGLYWAICDHIDSDQLNCVWDSVRDKLESREALNQSIALGRLNDLLNSVDSLMNTIGEFSDGFSGEDVTEAMHQLRVLTGEK